MLYLCLKIGNIVARLSKMKNFTKNLTVAF